MTVNKECKVPRVTAIIKSNSKQFLRIFKSMASSNAIDSNVNWTLSNASSATAGIGSFMLVSNSHGSTPNN